MVIVVVVTFVTRVYVGCTMAVFGVGSPIYPSGVRTSVTVIFAGS